MSKTHLVTINEEGVPDPYNCKDVSKAKKHHVVFVGPDSFTVKFKDRKSPFQNDTFDDDDPCTGPARNNAEEGQYEYEVKVKSQKPHNPGPTIIITP